MSGVAFQYHRRFLCPHPPPAPALRNHWQFPNRTLWFLSCGFCPMSLSARNTLPSLYLGNPFLLFRTWFSVGKRHGRLCHFWEIFLRLLHSSICIRGPVIVASVVVNCNHTHLTFFKCQIIPRQELYLLSHSRQC